TDILDNVYENVQYGVQQFISNSMFLILSGDGWTNVSKNSMLNFIVTNEKHESQILKIDNFSNQYYTGDNIFAIYKEIGISFGDKWIAFISDKLVGSAMLKPQYPCITHWATFTKASKITLQVQRSLKVFAFIHPSYLNSHLQENNIVDTINDHEFWTKLELFYELLKLYDYIIKILETENATLGQVAASWTWLCETINKSSLTITNNDFQDFLINEIDNCWEKIFNSIYLITWFLYLYYHEEGLNPTWHLYIQETAYSLFCTFYPNYDQNKFIDELLSYSNQEAPNLSEFVCHLLSISPNSATSKQ
ncbi:10986_t:CDS:2, partial [Cetraspora pellucida]